MFIYNWGGQRNHEDLNKPFIPTAAGPVYFTSWKHSGNLATQKVNSIENESINANMFYVPAVKKCRELNSTLGSISEHEPGIFDQPIRGTQSAKHSQIGNWKSKENGTTSLMEKVFDLYTEFYGTTSGRPLLEIMAAKLSMLFGGAYSYRYIWKTCQNIVHNHRFQARPTWETSEILRRKGKILPKRSVKVWKPARMKRRNEFLSLSMTSSGTALRNTLDDMYHRAPSQPMGYIRDRISLIYEEVEPEELSKVLQQPVDLFPPSAKPRINPFRHPLRPLTSNELASQSLSAHNQQVRDIFTIRSAIDGEIILQTVPERAEKHVYNEVEGHEHQFSDFSLDIHDNSVIQQRIEEKLEQIKMQSPNVEQMQAMVRQNAQVFLAKNMKIDVKVSTMHHIETRGEPFKEAPQRLGAAQREILTKEVQNMINVGVIRKSSSPWASRLLVVKKPDGSWRPCVDYRKLNIMTKTDSYPLPYIDDLLFRLGGANIFSKFDLYSGFWQMPLNPSDAEKTAFTTPLGLFEWITMPYGLKNALASFQRMMDKALHEAVTMGYCMVYMDDIVVFSKTEQEHVEHVEKVIPLINNANLRMKIEKCDFGQKEIDLLDLQSVPWYYTLRTKMQSYN